MTDRIAAITCTKWRTPWPTWGRRTRLPKCSVRCWVGSRNASTGRPRERWRAEGCPVVGAARNPISTVVAHEGDGWRGIPSGGNRPEADSDGIENLTVRTTAVLPKPDGTAPAASRGAPERRSTNANGGTSQEWLASLSGNTLV